MKPWEQLFVNLYLKATKGRKRYVTLPLVVIFFAIPAASGFLESYQKLAVQIRGYLEERTTHIDLEERDLLEDEEWGLIIHSYPNREEALKGRTSFTSDYLAAKHYNSNGEPIWINDILVVRDPKKEGRWLLAIDMYPSEFASEENLKKGLEEMIASEARTGVRGQPLQRWLSAAFPHKFLCSEFEKTWGRIENLEPNQAG